MISFVLCMGLWMGIEERLAGRLGSSCCLDFFSPRMLRCCVARLSRELRCRWN